MFRLFPTQRALAMYLGYLGCDAPRGISPPPIEGVPHILSQPLPNPTKSSRTLRDVSHEDISEQ